MRNILFRAAFLAVLLLAFGATGARADMPDETISQERLEFAEMPKVCPVCGSAKVAPIFHGRPAFNDEMERALAEGKIALGGCEVTGDDPSWKCLSCGALFYEQNKATKNPAPAPPNL